MIQTITAYLHTMGPSTQADSDEFTGSIGQLNQVNKRDRDVLFGRGRAVHDHPGNRSFRQLIVARSLEYKENAQDKSYRRAIAMEIIGSVQSQGGRFLKKKTTKESDRDCWVIAPVPTTLTKVKQALRDTGANAKVTSKESEEPIKCDKQRSSLVATEVVGGSSASLGFSRQVAARSLLAEAQRTPCSSQAEIMSRLQRFEEEKHIRSVLLHRRAQHLQQLELLARIHAEEQAASRMVLQAAAATRAIISPGQMLPWAPSAFDQSVGTRHLQTEPVGMLPTSTSRIPGISDVRARLNQGKRESLQSTTLNPSDHVAGCTKSPS